MPFKRSLQAAKDSARPEDEHKCRVCKQVYGNKNQFQKHLRDTGHGFTNRRRQMEQTSTTTTLSGCSCGKRFLTNRDLIAHTVQQARRGFGQRHQSLVHNSELRQSSDQENVDMEDTDSGSVAQTQMSYSLGESKNRLYQGKGMLIEAIQKDRIQATDTQVTVDDGTDVICSYNWIDQAEPAILVPGGPPLFDTLALANLPTQLTQGTSISSNNEGASRAPSCPFGPVFQALDVMHPNFHFDTVDLLTDTKSLEQLFAFLGPTNISSYTNQGFTTRLNLFLINNTLIVERVGPFTAYRHEDPGLLKGFKGTFSRWPESAPNCSTHHRILHYSLGPLSCVLRSRTDACLNEDDILSRSVHQNALYRPTLNRLRALDMTEAIPGGLSVPQAAMAATTLRTEGDRAACHLMKLWLERLPFLVTGNHTDGTLSTVDVLHAMEPTIAWEEREQGMLRKLAGLIARLRAVVREAGGGGCFALFGEGSGVMEVFTSVEGRGLADVVVDRFWR